MAVTARYSTRRQFITGVAAVGVAVVLPALPAQPVTATEVLTGMSVKVMPIPNHMDEMNHMLDAMRYGMGVMKDGQHVPASEWLASAEDDGVECVG